MKIILVPLFLIILVLGISLDFNPKHKVSNISWNCLHMCTINFRLQNISDERQNFEVKIEGLFVNTQYKETIKIRPVLQRTENILLGPGQEVKFKKEYPYRIKPTKVDISVKAKTPTRV